MARPFPRVLWYSTILFMKMQQLFKKKFVKKAEFFSAFYKIVLKEFPTTRYCIKCGFFKKRRRETVCFFLRCPYSIYNGKANHAILYKSIARPAAQKTGRARFTPCLSVHRILPTAPVQLSHTIRWVKAVCSTNAPQSRT